MLYRVDCYTEKVLEESENVYDLFGTYCVCCKMCSDACILTEMICTEHFLVEIDLNYST